MDVPGSETDGTGAPLVKRDDRGRFLPGFAVANPNGRPKGSGARPRLVEVARRYGISSTTVRRGAQGRRR